MAGCLPEGLARGGEAISFTGIWIYSGLPWALTVGSRAITAGREVLVGGSYRGLTGSRHNGKNPGVSAESTEPSVTPCVKLGGV